MLVKISFLRVLNALSTLIFFWCLDTKAVDSMMLKTLNSTQLKLEDQKLSNNSNDKILRTMNSTKDKDLNAGWWTARLGAPKERRLFPSSEDVIGWDSNATNNKPYQGITQENQNYKGLNENYNDFTKLYESKTSHKIPPDKFTKLYSNKSPQAHNTPTVEDYNILYENTSLHEHNYQSKKDHISFKTKVAREYNTPPYEVTEQYEKKTPREYNTPPREYHKLYTLKLRAYNTPPKEGPELYRSKSPREYNTPPREVHKSYTHEKFKAYNTAPDDNVYKLGRKNSTIIKGVNLLYGQKTPREYNTAPAETHNVHENKVQLAYNTPPDDIIYKLSRDSTPINVVNELHEKKLPREDKTVPAEDHKINGNKVQLAYNTPPDDIIYKLSRDSTLSKVVNEFHGKKLPREYNTAPAEDHKLNGNKVQLAYNTPPDDIIYKLARDSTPFKEVNKVYEIILPREYNTPPGEVTKSYGNNRLRAYNTPPKEVNPPREYNKSPYEATKFHKYKSMLEYNTPPKEVKKLYGSKVPRAYNTPPLEKTTRKMPREYHTTLNKATKLYKYKTTREYNTPPKEVTKLYINKITREYNTPPGETLTLYTRKMPREYNTPLNEVTKLYETRIHREFNTPPHEMTKLYKTNALRSYNTRLRETNHKSNNLDSSPPNKATKLYKNKILREFTTPPQEVTKFYKNNALRAYNTPPGEKNEKSKIPHIAPLKKASKLYIKHSTQAYNTRTKEKNITSKISPLAPPKEGTKLYGNKILREFNTPPHEGTKLYSNKIPHKYTTSPKKKNKYKTTHEYNTRTPHIGVVKLLVKKLFEKKILRLHKEEKSPKEDSKYYECKVKPSSKFITQSEEDECKKSQEGSNGFQIVAPIENKRTTLFKVLEIRPEPDDKIAEGEVTEPYIIDREYNTPPDEITSPATSSATLFKLLQVIDDDD